MAASCNCGWWLVLGTELSELPRASLGRGFIGVRECYNQGDCFVYSSLGNNLLLSGFLIEALWRALQTHCV